MGTRQIGLQDIVEGARTSGLRLLAPLRYLCIKHNEKQKYDVVLPVALGVVLWAVYMIISPKPHLFGDGGLLRFTRDLLIMSVPFMVGALAAVSMGAPGPHLDRRPVGAELFLGSESLTLRQFLCYLLGYLCFLGLVILMCVVAAELLREPVLSWTSEAPFARASVMAIGSLSLSLLLCALSVTVFWSLYFLTDVANRT